MNEGENSKALKEQYEKEYEEAAVPTGISQLTVANQNAQEEIYDLQGRRVQNATKGLYIRNGKKVVVK
jgi:uncharacterized GH25 family protein